MNTLIFPQHIRQCLVIQQGSPKTAVFTFAPLSMELHPLGLRHAAIHSALSPPDRWRQLPSKSLKGSLASGGGHDGLGAAPPLGCELTAGDALAGGAAHEFIHCQARVGDVQKTIIKRTKACTARGSVAMPTCRCGRWRIIKGVCRGCGLRLDCRNQAARSFCSVRMGTVDNELANILSRCKCISTAVRMLNIYTTVATHQHCQHWGCMALAAAAAAAAGLAD